MLIYHYVVYCVVLLGRAQSSFYICECSVKRYFTHYHSIVLSYFPLKATTASCKHKMQKLKHQMSTKSTLSNFQTISDKINVTNTEIS